MNAMYARTTWSVLFGAMLFFPATAWGQDADGDGLSDADETNIYMTNTMSVDTDGDGLSDSDEVFNRQTVPTLKDSDGGGVDDYTEILSGTDPNLMSDDATGTANGPGSTSTWVFSTVTMTNIATSEARFQEVIPNDFRSFISTVPINYSDRVGAHGPFSADRTQIQDVWGVEPSYYAWTFSGHLVVPAATAANPQNKHTIAASTDDGFRLRVHDGTDVQQAQYDANRGVGTGPLLTVDFPDEGGVFAFDFLTWEQGGAATSQLSWIPGEVATFDASTFTLIPATRMVGPDLTAIQELVDIDGGQVVTGDTLEATVNITNRGQAAAYNLRFLPNRRSNVTFSNFVTTPVGSTIVADEVNIPLLNPGQTITVVYQATADAAMNYSVQGEVLADTSAIPTVGTQRVRVLTDDPRVTSNVNDIGNRPKDIYGDGASDDDPNVFTALADLFPPAVAIATPVDNSDLNTNPISVSGTTEIGATVNVDVLDDAGANVFSGPATVDAAGNWSVSVPGLTDGEYTVQATASDAAGNEATDAHNFALDQVAPTVAVTAPTDGSSTNDTTPTLTGTTEPNLAVILTITDGNGNAQTVNATADAAGNFSVPAPTLVDGEYTVSAQATDAAGNVSPVSNENTFTVDTADPTLTLTTPIDGSSTNDTTPILSGTTEPNAAVVLTLEDSNGNTQTVNTTADASGNFSVPAPTLAEGDYNVTAQATDDAGNTSPVVGPNTFTVDTQPPSVTLATPADGLITATNVLSVSGATEPGSSVEVVVTDASGVEVQRLPATVDAAGNYIINTRQLPDGVYTIEAIATDAAGNSASAGPHSVIIDVTAPALSLDAPVDSSITNNNTPDIEGTTEDNATVTLVISDDQGNVVETITALADGDGDYTALPMTLVDGTYTITASTTDAAGNTTTTTPNAFTVDTQVPTVAITSPADGSTTAEKRPDVSGVTEPGSSVEVSLLDDQGNVILTETVTADAATGAFTVSGPLADLADGTYTIEAESTDLAGNVANTTSTFDVNSSALALTIDAPAQGSSTSNDTPDITGTTAPMTTVTVVLTDANGLPVGAPLVVTSDMQGDYTTAPAMTLPDGEYTATATVVSPGGLTTTETSTFTVDTMIPTLTLDAPTDGAETADDTPEFVGTTEPGATVTLVITDDQGMEVETITVVADPSGAYTVDAAQLPEGAYTVNATAVDAAGNMSPAVGPVGFVVDVTTPVVEITSPATDEVVATREAPIAGTSDPNQEVLIEVTDDVGIVVFSETVTTDAAGVWTVNTTSLADGTYTATATATDAAGNTSTDSEPFSVDSTEALLTITSPTEGDATTTVRPTVTGQADADAQVTVVFTDNAGNVIETVVATVNPDGTYSATPTNDLPEGDYTVSVNATRPNGTMADEDVTFTVDTTVPDIAITSPAQDSTVSSLPTITGTTEPGSSVNVVITDDAGTVVFEEVVEADAQGNFSVTPGTELPDGEYTVDATSTDAAGNEATADPVGFSVNQDVPQVTITSPTVGEDVSDTTPTISGEAPAGSTVEIFIDGVSVGTTEADAQGQWSFDVPEDQALGQGTHNVEAKVELDGVEGTSGTISFDVVPSSGELTIDTPTEDSTVTGPSITVSGKGTPGQEVTVTIGDKTQTVTVDDDGNWSATVEDVPAGDTTITATSGDDSVSVSVTVDDVVDSNGFVLEGGGFSCSSTSQGGPLNTLALVLLSMGGLVFWRRRR